ncbi:MAG: nitrogenase component 1 [Candidatus Omnitrophota bacterium]
MISFQTPAHPKLPVKMDAANKPVRSAAQNTCKLCTPLGACLAFRGIHGAVPLVHGSQGCSTYMRRYLISHFREPVDIASSNFSEHSAIFGGGENLQEGLRNVIRQYAPQLIGVATTCLTETIGDDVKRILCEFIQNAKPGDPPIVPVSTPSYTGTYVDGFHAAVRETVVALAKKEPAGAHLNLFPGIVSPEDLRYLKELASAFAIEIIMLPDYSDTLDGESWSEFHRIPAGGTTIADIARTGSAQASLAFGRIAAHHPSAAAYLAEKLAVPALFSGSPIGIDASDTLCQTLKRCSGNAIPEPVLRERGRLVDAYADGHKYVFGQRVAIIAEDDLAVALAGWLAEIGAKPVLVAAGGHEFHLKTALTEMGLDLKQIQVLADADFARVEAAATELKPDLILGSSKASGLARKLAVPLVRVGFPVHDRFGAQRIAHLGYRGTQQLFDRLVNALLEKKQNESVGGYSYL